MEVVIKRRHLKALSAMEDDPHSTLAMMAIGDMLLGHNETDVIMCGLVFEYELMFPVPVLGPIEHRRSLQEARKRDDGVLDYSAQGDF